MVVSRITRAQEHYPSDNDNTAILQRNVAIQYVKEQLDWSYSLSASPVKNLSLSLVACYRK